MIRGFLLAVLLLAPVPAAASDITRSTLAAAAAMFDMPSRDTGADHRIQRTNDDGEHPREPRKQPVGCRQQRCNKNHGESVVGQYYRNRSGDQTQ